MQVSTSPGSRDWLSSWVDGHSSSEFLPLGIISFSPTTVRTNPTGIYDVLAIQKSVNESSLFLNFLDSAPWFFYIIFSFNEWFGSLSTRPFEWEFFLKKKWEEKKKEKKIKPCWLCEEGFNFPLKCYPEECPNFQTEKRGTPWTWWNQSKLWSESRPTVLPSSIQSPHQSWN